MKTLRALAVQTGLPKDLIDEIDASIKRWEETLAKKKWDIREGEDVYESQT